MAVETTTLVRFYEATVTQPSATSAPSSSLVAATFVSFPWAPPDADKGWWSTPNAVARSLGLRPEHGPDYSQWPDAIPSFVARTLVDNTLAVEAPAEDVEADLTRILEESLARHDADLAAAKRFLAELLDKPVIPIEESPLSGASLAQLLGRAPEAAGAAVAAWGTAPDQTFLLLITMPTGMIVLGAAAGVAKALNTGLRAKILGWMRVPDPLRPAPASEPSAASEAKDQANRSLKRRLRDKLDESGAA